MPNVMVALPNIGGALRSTPQTLADAHYCKNHMLVINACDAHHVGEGNTIFWHNYGHTMCRSMVDIQSATAEIRQGKKEERKKHDKNTMSASGTQGGHKRLSLQENSKLSSSLDLNKPASSQQATC